MTLSLGMGLGITSVSNSVGPSLVLDFMRGQVDPRISFTRAAGGATYYDNTGTLQLAATNAPRIDYGPTQYITNLQLWSTTSSGWSPAGPISVTGNVALAPDGSTTGALLAAADTTNSVRTSSGVPLAVTAANVYTISCHFKRTATNAFIQVNFNFSANAACAYFDLGAGTGLVGADLVGTVTGKSVTIVPAANGWYRAGITLTAPSGSTSLTVYTGACQTVSSTGDNRSYTGVTGQGVYSWGAQVETGSIASQYVPTTGVAVAQPISSAGTTNLIIKSEQLDDGNWLKSNCTVTANSSVAPDGNMTMDKLSDVANTSIHYSSAATPVISGSVNTFSFYAKAAELRYFQLGIDDGSANGPIATFDVTGGTTSVVNNGTGTGASSSITSVGNGIYRCSVTGIAGPTASIVRLVIALANIAAPTIYSAYTGVGGQGVYFWGAQLNAGNLSNTYVSTTTAIANSGAIPLGLLVEESRVNSIRNPRAEGAVAGTPGTSPTNGWLLPTVGGNLSSVCIVAIGTESGISFIDISFVTSGAVAFDVYPDTSGGVATNGQTWTYSLYVRLMGGSNVNTTQSITLFELGGTPTSTTTFFTPTIASLASQRMICTRTNTIAGTTSESPRYNANVSGAASWTIRLGAPQLELGAFITSPILPAIGTPVATTRGTEIPTVPLVPAASYTLEAEAMQPASGGAIMILAQIDNGAAARSVLCCQGNAVEFYDTVSGVLYGFGFTLVYGVPFKAAAAFTALLKTGSFNGGTVGIENTPAMTLPAGLTTLRLGYYSSQAFSGYLRRIKYWPRNLANSELITVTT